MKINYWPMKILRHMKKGIGSSLGRMGIETMRIFSLPRGRIRVKSCLRADRSICWFRSFRIRMSLSWTIFMKLGSFLQAKLKSKSASVLRPIKTALTSFKNTWRTPQSSKTHISQTNENSTWERSKNKKVKALSQQKKTHHKNPCKSQTIKCKVQAGSRFNIWSEVITRAQMKNSLQGLLLT